jgi:hypothetical protein
MLYIGGVAFCKEYVKRCRSDQTVDGVGTAPAAAPGGDPGVRCYRIRRDPAQVRPSDQLDPRCIPVRTTLSGSYSNPPGEPAIIRPESGGASYREP